MQANGLLPSNNLADLTSVAKAQANLGLGTAALHSTAEFAPAATIAGLAVRCPGLMPIPTFDRVAPTPYVRYSATDSVQFSNLVGGGGGGVTLTLGQRTVQVNDTVSSGTRYTYSTHDGGAGGPTWVNINGRLYWNFAGTDSIASQGTWATLNDCTLFALCRPRRFDFDGLFELGPNGFTIAGARVNWFNQAPIGMFLNGRPGVDTAVVVRLTASPTRLIEVFLDGVRVISVTNSSTSALGATNGAIGTSNGASTFDGLISEWGVFNSLLPDQQVAWLSQGLMSRATAPDVEAAPIGINLLVEGNSIVDPFAGLSSGNQTGFGPPFPPTQQWPGQLRARQPSWSITNLAVSSRWTTPIGGLTNGGNTISPTFAAHLATYFVPGKTNVLVLHEGINHLINLIVNSVSNPGTVAAQALLTLGTTAIAAGWKVVIGTLSNRADGGSNATYQTEYLVANAYLRANGSGTSWHALADFGGDSRFQDPSNGLYILSTDNVHWTCLAHSIARATYFGPAIVTAAAA